MTTTWDRFDVGTGDCAPTIERVTVLPYQFTVDGPVYDLLRIVITPPLAALDLVYAYRLKRVWQANEDDANLHLNSWEWSVPGSAEVSSFSPMPLRPPIICGHLATRAGEPDYPYNLVIYPRFYDPPETPDIHDSRVIGFTTDMAQVGWPYGVNADPESGSAPLDVAFSLVGLT